MTISDELINRVFASAWDIAVQSNPMLLAKHEAQNTIEQARARIGALLAEGYSEEDALKFIVADLLDPNSALYKSTP
jgi:hypothetical protein